MPDDKAMLQTAAVIGYHVAFTILEAIVKEPSDGLRHSLGRLQGAGFLNETRRFPNLEFTFRHALTHEVAYGSILHQRRTVLHREIFEAMERIYSGRLTEHVDGLAHHAIRGAVWDKAVLYLRLTGAKGLDRSAYREAAVSFELALTALGHLPGGREKLEQEIDLRLQLVTALFPLGEFGRVVAILREAQEVAEALADPRRHARASVYASISCYLTGNMSDALESARRTLGLAQALPDVGLQAVGNQYLGVAHSAKTDYREAEEYFARSVSLLEGPLRTERLGLAALPSVQSRAFRAWCLAEVGRFSEAVPLAEEAVSIAEGNTTASVVLASWGAGQVHLRRGNAVESIAHLERALSLNRVPLYFRYVAPVLGAAYILVDRFNEAVSLLEQSVEQDIAMGYLAHHAQTVASLGEAYLGAGRLPEASESAQRALKLARDRHERGHEAYASRLVGRIILEEDPAAEKVARRHYQEALELSSQLGMRPLAAHCHLDLGRCYQRLGQGGRARQHISTGASMYREMEMRFWLERAEAMMDDVRGE